MVFVWDSTPSQLHVVVQWKPEYPIADSTVLPLLWTSVVNLCCPLLHRLLGAQVFVI